MTQQNDDSPEASNQYVEEPKTFPDCPNCGVKGGEGRAYPTFECHNHNCSVLTFEDRRKDVEFY